MRIKNHKSEILNVVLQQFAGLVNPSKSLHLSRFGVPKLLTKMYSEVFRSGPRWITLDLLLWNPGAYGCAQYWARRIYFAAWTLYPEINKCPSGENPGNHWAKSHSQAAKTIETSFGQKTKHFSQLFWTLLSNFETPENEIGVVLWNPGTFHCSPTWSNSAESFR